MKELINVEKIKQGISALKSPDELFEIRILDNTRKQSIIGFFKDTDVMIKSLDKVDTRGKNVYITVNGIDEDLYSTTPHDRFVAGATSTSDNDVNRYEWLFIDLDPVRKSGISSSQEEVQKSVEVAGLVREWMQSIGFSDPLTAMSGNGTHLLYKIDLPVTDETKALIKRCLEVIADLFNTDKIKIDTVNYNPARICKLYGTLAQKGADTEKRPHRMSHLITKGSDKVNGIELLKKIGGELPEQKQPVKMAAPVRKEFDLLPWMSEHGLSYFSTGSGAGGSTIYNLDACPFDASHTHGDAKIFQYSDGAIAFKCHHNSCRNYKWQDLREKLEPGAYDQEQDDGHIDRGWQQHKQAMKYVITKTTDDVEEVKKNLRKVNIISAAQLLAMKFDEQYFAVENMIPEGETVIAAPPKYGKSWLMLGMCLAVSSGEDFLTFKTRKAGTLYLALEDGDSFEQERLKLVLKGKPAPENCHFVFADVEKMQNGFILQMEDIIEQHKDIKVIVIDTLNFIKYQQSKMESAYDCDYRTGRDLKQFAEKHKIAVVVVTHTTKMIHAEDDMSNVSGTNGVTGAADAVIVLNKESRMSKKARMLITGRKVRQSLHDIEFNDETCAWNYIGVSDQEGSQNAERRIRETEYQDSKVRAAVIEIARNLNYSIDYKSSEIIAEAAKHGIGLLESSKEVGGFLCKYIGMFLERDGLQIEIINNGSGSKTYRIFPKRSIEEEYGEVSI